MSSKCPRCENTSFELEQAKLSSTHLSYYFAQCSKCKTVVGVIEHQHSGDVISQLNNKIDNLNNKIDNLEHAIKRGIR